MQTVCLVLLAHASASLDIIGGGLGTGKGKEEKRWTG